VPGFKNILFGGDGLFLATLTGPGHVALQSMPIMNLAEEIGRYLPNNSSSESSSSTAVATGVAGSIVGGVLGSLFGSGDDRKT